MPIVERQLAMFASHRGRAREWSPSRPAPLAHLGLEIVPDVVDGGALGGLYTALETAVTEAVVVVAGDMPFLTARFVEALLDASGQP